ncbi:hypothetical protein ACIBI4_25680 [Streptomyces sp. NPDC050418]|uniref:hypothetical protein n=1 Tax=Streptomyces sp. NPDC050418 TaxID=3365612 RepID=UPI0037AE3C3E
MSTSPQQQNPYGRQNPYADQQPIPAQGQPRWGAGWHNPATGPVGCRFCGGMPAERVTFRAHQGLLIAMRFQKLDGSMCAACGEGVYREMSGKTLWQGWWSPFSLVFFTPFALLSNLFARRRVRALQPPVPGQHGAQVPAGVPLHKRPLSYVALIPPLWFGFLVISGVFFGDPLGS